MAKQGMKRIEPEHKKNTIPPVPEISGKAKSGKEKAKPLINGTGLNRGKVFHIDPTLPYFGAIGNELATENLISDMDMTAADLEDFRENKA